MGCMGVVFSFIKPGEYKLGEYKPGGYKPGEYKPGEYKPGEYKLGEGIRVNENTHHAALLQAT